MTGRDLHPKEQRDERDEFSPGSLSLGPGDDHGSRNTTTGTVIGTFLVGFGGVSVVLASRGPFAGSAGPQALKPFGQFGQFGTDLLQAMSQPRRGGRKLVVAAAGTHRIRLTNKVAVGLSLLVGACGTAVLTTSLAMLASDDKSNDVQQVLGFLLLGAGSVGDCRRLNGHGPRYRIVTHDGLGVAAARHRDERGQT